MISSSTAKVAYTLTTTTETLTVPFYFLESSHLKVIKTVSGVHTTLSVGTHYTVSGAGVPAGGSITLTGVAVAVGNTVTIRRSVPKTQLVDYVKNDRFPADTHERALDKLTMMIQEQEDQLDRAIQLPEAEDGGAGNILPTAVDRAGKLLGFGSGGAVQLITPDAVEVVAGDGLVVPSIADLRLLSVEGLPNRQPLTALGYYAPNDGGGGLFYLDTSSSATDNGGTIIAPGVGTGRWLRVHGDMVNVRWFGAKGDGSTDDSATVQAAMAYVRTKSALVSPSGGDLVSLLGAYFPAGTYLITTSEALLPSSFATKTRGLKIKGAGRGLSIIWFKPTAGTRYLMHGANSYRVNDIEDFTFVSDSTANTFLYSVSNTGGCQRWNFSRCEWAGVWGKGMHLTGGNNNSEWTFHDCGVYGEMTDFLFVPDAGASDQFLNFWFDQMKFWPTESARPNCWINMSRGGHVKITNCDASGIQNGVLFKLQGATHAFGVCHFICAGTRFEMKSINTKVIESAWPFGAIVFRDCDFSSQAFSTPSGPVIPLSTVMFEFNDVNVPGATLLFEGCSLLASIKFTHGTNDFSHRKVTTFLNCEHAQFPDFFDAFIFTSSTNDGGHRPIRVINCRGTGTALSFLTAWASSTAYVLGNQRVNGRSLYEVTVAGTSAGSGGPTGRGGAITDGTVTWKWVRNDQRDYATEATIGAFVYANPVGIHRHCVSFKAAAGNLPTAGGVLEIILPPNVVIVSARIFAPAGSVTSSAIADYKIQTMEASPTDFAVVSTTPASGGFNDEWTGFFPVGTDNAKRAVRLVVGAGVDQANFGAFAVLEYIG